MAKIIDLSKVKPNYIAKKIKVGSIFIYPTDTIYGIGCNALNPDAVQRIRDIKGRFDRPFSVIAPSKPWITKNFKIGKSYVAKLPGPFTYVMKQKTRSKLVCKEVNFGGSLGVRIPNHPFTKVVQKSKLPFVTTSVNMAGKKFYLEIRKIPRRIMNAVDIVIDGGRLDNPPSTVIDFSGPLPKILR